jgi:AAA+ ATPase superfamily predicted ATPase
MAKMMFIGRKNELEDLHSLYQKDNFRLAMLYGRRRIGKTELVLRSLKESNLPSLYFQCKQTSEKDNAISLSSLKLLPPPLFFEQFISEQLSSSFLPRSFEKVASEYLLLENKRGRITPPLLLLGRGVYHDKINRINGEFDVMGKQEKGWIYYECKYEKNPVSKKEMIHLEEQLSRCSLSYLSLGFFSKSSFQEDALSYAKEKGYYLRNLANLYLVSD